MSSSARGGAWVGNHGMEHLMATILQLLAAEYTYGSVRWFLPKVCVLRGLRTGCHEPPSSATSNFIDIISTYRFSILATTIRIFTIVAGVESMSSISAVARTKGWAMKIYILLNSIRILVRSFSVKEGRCDAAAQGIQPCSCGCQNLASFWHFTVNVVESSSPP